MARVCYKEDKYRNTKITIKEMYVNKKRGKGRSKKTRWIE